MSIDPVEYYFYIWLIRLNDSEMLIRSRIPRSSFEDGSLVPTACAADGGDVLAVFRCDGSGAVAELEVFGSGEVLDECTADCLRLSLRDVLVEVEHATCHHALGDGTVVGAGAGDDILAERVDSGDIGNAVRSRLSDKPVKAVLLAGAGGDVAQYIVL